MATFREAERASEGQLFVGRERELEVFSEWLDAETPQILSVSGPGGSGKTTLIAAFARLARERGRDVKLIEGGSGDFRPTSDDLPGAAFLHALGGGDTKSVLAKLKATHPRP